MLENQPDLHVNQRLEFFLGEFFVSGISDRKQEIKRRRARRKKLKHFQAKLKKATTSERGVIAEKLRRMTPGCEIIIANWGLEERK